MVCGCPLPPLLHAEQQCRSPIFSAQGRHSNTSTGSCQQSDRVLQHIDNMELGVQGNTSGESHSAARWILGLAAVSLAA